MTTVDASLVMALRRLTGAPVSDCREALVEAGGDFLAVVRRLRQVSCYGLVTSDAEVAAALESAGVAAEAVEKTEVRPVESDAFGASVGKPIDGRARPAV